MTWRKHDEASAKAAYAMVREMFPEPELDGFEVVAEDWTGRQYGLSGRRLLLFDPGWADIYEVGYDTVDEAVAEDPDFYLCAGLLREWRARHPERVPDGHCVGYRRPLFLGGEDSVENLEVIDVQVYWSVHAQVWHQVKDLPPGTPISGMDIS
ncbi:DUF1851 domain-containing protein [Lentzea alba]|uniref:T6SS immunity protein Tdi1 domain-containing protein n=1 Tax=Lentzea alba TaxID=2714351 RepID=UPI0039BF8A75